MYQKIQLSNVLTVSILFRGVISPNEARLRSIHQLNRMVEDGKIILKYTHLIVIVFSGLCVMLYTGTVARYMKPDQRFMGYFWALISSVWAYYTLGVSSTKSN